MMGLFNNITLVNRTSMRYYSLLFLLIWGGIQVADAQKSTHLPQKRFHLLSPKQTHITFNNRLEDHRDHNILIYSNYYGGAGVGIADLNQDGLQDIFFAGNLVADQLYLNRGNMTFEEITQQAGIQDNGGWSSGVVMADVNGDGWTDIYVTRELYDDQPDLRKNKLYLNQGTTNGKGIPQFQEVAEAWGVADPQRTRHATFLDYDRDGDLDLLLLNQPPNPGDYSQFYNTELLQPQYRIRLLSNEGTTFTDVTEAAGLNRTGFPNTVTPGDFNGDGWTDLYIANDFWVEDWLFFNRGDGTFEEKIHENTRHISNSSMGVDAGDINNDGLLDLMVLDMVAEDNYRLKTNMSGMDPKAFWKVVKDGGHYQYMFNTLQLNTGQGHFSDIAQLGKVASTDWSWSVLMADLDNDGWKDIHVTNGLMRDIRNNDASKTFKKYVESSLHTYLQANPNPSATLTLWDIVDLDKTLSLVPSEKLSNYVFKNEGDFTFSQHMEDWGMDQKSFSNGSAYADLDNDGDLDLVVNNINDAAFVYENQTSNQGKHHFLRIQPIADAASVTIAGTQVWIHTPSGTQFHELTHTRGMYSSSEMIAHFGLGEETQVVWGKIRWADGKETQLKEVEVDQLLTINYTDAVAHDALAQAPPLPLLKNITPQLGQEIRHTENHFDDFRSQVLLPHKMSTFGPCLAVGDVNGDGREDVFLGGAAAEPAQLYAQQADGSLTEIPQEIFTRDNIHEDVGAALFDVDMDGDLDLYVVSGGNEFLPGSDAYQDRLYLNDGKGQFEGGKELLPEMLVSGSKVRPADFDQDGDLDVLVTGRHTPWAYPEPTSSFLLVNEGGQLTNNTTTLAPMLTEIGMVNDAVWWDYNQDGWEDLMLVGEWMPLTLLENQYGKGFVKVEHEELDAATGWWFSVEKADIDQDGDLDLIAGNLGLNYKYQASIEEPFEVYFYDFDENGSKDVVLTYYNFGIQYPVRGRQCSAEQVPELKEKFGNYDLFASSDVFDIYGKNELENALHYSANTFASVYLENLGGGDFKLHPLPTEAQFSSVNDIVVEDVNQDGYSDVVLAGNLYQAEVETARNDAGYGLVLIGDGQGGFQPLPWEESGFFVPFDVKTMAPLNGPEGDQRILIGSNNDVVRLFKLTHSKSHQ